ncbi:PPE family protein [Mycobacterium sp.]|uniref:PPE family protein n=1 Tax=Mycobacterium sp. TaxID=1785 RepID=UPI003BAD1D96
MDFSALPPEINSARMYAGPGSGPMVEAATAWDTLAAELSSAATSYRAVLAELTDGPWLGPVSMTMAAATAPYMTWMSSTATQAALTASQATAAAAAYEAAFAATVPPPLVTENRAVLALLVTTNLFGQNAPAIATTEAHYAEMWAQDAAAMYGYAGSSATATQLTRFTSPPNITNPGGASAQSAAVAETTGTSTASHTSSVLSQLLSTVPNALEELASGAPINPINWLESLSTTSLPSLINRLLQVTGTHLSNLSGLFFAASVTPFFLAPLMPLALPAAAATDASAVADGTLGASLVGSAGPAAGSSVSAGMGEAALVGNVSVPPSWGTAAPEIQLASAALPAANPAGALTALPTGASGWSGAIPPMAGLVNAPRHTGARPPSTSASEPANPQAGGSRAAGAMPGRWVPAEHRAHTTSSPLSARERDDLEAMRKELAELAMERDAAARLIREAIQP